MARSAQEVQQAVESEFTPLVRSVFGDALESITLYGSVVKPTFDPSTSDVNVLVLVAEASPAALREFGRRSRRLLRNYRITPLLLTTAEFTNSADVFPMEYLDIKAAHTVIDGRDVTADLQISDQNLRHEVEHALRGSLVALRQLTIAASRSRPFRKALLQRRLLEWYGSLSAILRGLLRLSGADTVPDNPEQLVAEINRSLGLEPGALMTLLACRSGDCPDSMELLDGLLERLQRLVEIVDAGLAKGGS